MHKTTLMLAVSFLLPACAAMTPPTGCEGQSSTPAKIHYGDSELQVTPQVTNVHRNGDFVLRLQPNKRRSDTVDYEDVEVTVIGKAGAEWITEMTATYNSAENHRFVYCVPENQGLTDYYYEVTVSDVGKLDPRVRVTN